MQKILVFFGLAVCSVAAVAPAPPLQPAGPTPTKTAALAKPPAKADNAPCYVCHLELQKEDITTVHLAAGVGCVKCHGLSDDHMHDEMLMTKPDRLFGRREVGPLCAECHDDPHKQKDRELKAFLDQWRGRDRPNGRVVNERSICTDCHGTHNIVKNLGLKKAPEEEAQWTALFDGQSLAGWSASDPHAWSTRNGRLVGTPPATAAADLWTTAQFENYRLSMTFQATWPLRAGLWLRGLDGDRGWRVEILDQAAPRALPGSVLAPGARLALANLREDLLDREGWNTLAVEVRGDRVLVWLNGDEIGAVRTAGPAKGRIGLHLEAGPAYKHGQLAIREILIHNLADQTRGP